ncbi:MAG: DUF6688 domain-containing protein [Sediminibacterium sp.]|jgi:hypothetical protein
MIYLISILCGLPSLLLTVDFVKFLISGRRLYSKFITRILEVASMVGLPILYLWLLDENKNDCCSDSATFSPNHKLTIYLLIAICIIGFFYSSFKNNIASPVIEVLTNSLLLFGFVFNIFIAVQVGQIFWLFGNIPVGLLFIFQLNDNHKRFLKFNQTTTSEYENFFEKMAWKILTLSPLLKFPLLFILFLPFLTVITSLLLLFGQKPDSIVRAFTDTYKHGFSQLDYLCDNVQCGGHFLCSVAANGHKNIVSPIRYGERNGNKIICNRQLLIANAFEELVQQKLPKTHRIIRHQYNKVGNVIHRHYHIFKNKFVSDTIYILMKPFEIFFLLTLYTFDKRPENRIAKQYLNKRDIEALS